MGVCSQYHSDVNVLKAVECNSSNVHKVLMFLEIDIFSKLNIILNTQAKYNLKLMQSTL